MTDTNADLPRALDSNGRAIAAALAEAMGRGTLVRALLAIKRAHGWFLQQAAEHLWDLYGTGRECPTCGAWPRDLDDASPPRTDLP